MTELGGWVQKMAIFCLLTVHKSCLRSAVDGSEKVPKPANSTLSTGLYKMVYNKHQ